MDADEVMIVARAHGLGPNPLSQALAPPLERPRPTNTPGPIDLHCFEQEIQHRAADVCRRNHDLASPATGCRIVAHRRLSPRGTSLVWLPASMTISSRVAGRPPFVGSPNTYPVLGVTCSMKRPSAARRAIRLSVSGNVRHSLRRPVTVTPP